MADGKRRYKSDRKDYKMSVKLSEKDIDILNATLKRTGMTMSAYIRELIRTGGNIDNSYPDDRAKVIRIVVGIANNINQMAKLANAKGDIYFRDIDRLYVEESREMDDGDAELIYTGKNVTVDDVVPVIPMAADKVEWIADRLSECGAYEDVDVPVKADIFGFDIGDVSGSIRLFSDVMKRMGIKLAGDELYEEFQRIYDESVGRDAGKEKAEDKIWNMGRGR